MDPDEHGWEQESEQEETEGTEEEKAGLKIYYSLLRGEGKIMEEGEEPRNTAKTRRVNLGLLN